MEVAGINKGLIGFKFDAIFILMMVIMFSKKTSEIVYPVHLLLGLLKERTGVCAELFINYPELSEILNERVRKIQFGNEDGIKSELFTIGISQATEIVLMKAKNRMKHFKQVYINEGHIIDVLFKINDSFTKTIIDGLDIPRILEIVAFPRDMVVSLKDYLLPSFPVNEITFRKAKQSDAVYLKRFIEKEFGSRWLHSIEKGFEQEDIPIYIALDEQKIIGFACFDVVREKKGLFGPMGTSLSNRIQNVGYTLLHYCLHEMKGIGYEYAVIGEAGPIEFYEKACNAVIIPKN